MHIFVIESGHDKSGILPYDFIQFVLFLLKFLGAPTESYPNLIHSGRLMCFIVTEITLT